MTHLPIFIQWLLACLLFAVGIYAISLVDAWWKLIFVCFLIPFLQFCCVPLFRLGGIYRYLSPTVFAMPATKQRYELHNATIFDYLHQFSWSDKGRTVQQQLLVNYGQAFLRIIQLIEAKELPPTLEIYGQSYFFNERTAQKLGFQISPVNNIDKICSCLNAVELILLYSFSRGKWRIPSFWKISAMTISGQKLCEKKEHIEHIVRQFEKKG